MNAKRITQFLLILSMTIFGCKQDKTAQLNKLRKQQDDLTNQINKLKSEVDDPAKTVKMLRVTVEPAKPGVFKHYIEVQGKLDGEDNVDVFPEASGVIDEVLVTVGQKVYKGQPLAHIDKGPARDQLKALETQYQFASETYDKQQRLWDQKIGSEVQYLQAKSTKEQLESQIAATRKQIDMMTIKAPIDGTVEEVNVKVGQFTSSAIATPPFRVLNFSIIKVKAEVAEAYSHEVNVGDAVLVYLPDLDKEITATISTASRYINPTNRTFTVEVRLKPDNTGYKANMVAVLKINDYKAANTISVSVNYIQTDPNGNFVYVAQKDGEKNVAKKMFIEQGQSYNGQVEITKGLKAGDLIVTSGYLDLEPGELINF